LWKTEARRRADSRRRKRCSWRRRADFLRRPGADAPVKREHDHEEGNESERVKKHGAGSIELRCRDEQPIYVSHIEPDLLEVVSLSCKIDI